MKLLLISCALLASFLQAPAQSLISLQDKHIVYLEQTDYRLQFKAPEAADSLAAVQLVMDGKTVKTLRLSPVSGTPHVYQTASFRFPAGGQVALRYGSRLLSQTLRVIPGWLSLLPPLIAILLALISRQVLISLFAGVWLGAAFIYDYNPFSGFLMALTEYIGKAPADEERIAILIFSLVLGGMVGVISKAGGTQGIVQRLAGFASNAKRGQFAVWLMGVIIFFDDYANTLIVGNTMRPLTDRLKISREKLSYLVDSTAAPVANIAIISTWIGYELSLINESFQAIGVHDNAYLTFFKTIPYNFYPLFTLAFGLFIALSGRDMFSMLRAERRARDGQVLAPTAVPLADLNGNELLAPKNTPLRWYNAAIPVGVVIFSTLAGLWFTGLHHLSLPAEELQNMSWIRYVSAVIGKSDSFAVLMWASFGGSITAILLAIGQRILNLNDAMMAWVSGIKAMVMAALILTMAWAIGNVCSDLQTAEYVVDITRPFLSAHWLPMLSFIISGLIAFSTGTSWGTMAILAPIVIPLAHQLPAANPAIPPDVAYEIFLSSIAAILAGATFGDHCSPISDTTIMSSMASGADHIDHVRTQLPYALLAAGVSILFGYIPVGFGLHDWITLLAGFVVLALIVRFAGKKVTV